MPFGPTNTENYTGTLPVDYVGFNPINFENYWTHGFDWGLKNGDAISQAAFPGMQQFAEWSQQMLTQMYQNEWNSEQARMQRMLDAGINPYLAANGIAGQGTTGSVAAPPTAVGAGANSLRSFADAAIGAAGAITGGFQNIANATSLLGLLPHQIQNLESQSSKNLADVGFTEEQITGFRIDNKYRDSHHVADLNIKVQNFENMQAQWEILERDKQMVQKQLDTYDERIRLANDLTEKQAFLAEKQAYESKERTRLLKNENQFFEDFGFSPDSNVDTSLRNIWMKCSKTGDFTDYINASKAAYKYYNDLNYNLYSGQQLATQQFAYSIAEAHRKGENAADLINGHVNGWADLVNRGANFGISIVMNFSNGRAVRKQLAEVLNQLYDKLDAPNQSPETREQIIRNIDEINLLLQLSNKELYEFTKKK